MSTAVTVTGPFTAEFHNIGTLDPSWTRPTDVCSTVPIAPSGVSWPNNKNLIGQQVDNCGGWDKLWVPECELGGEKIDELYSAQASPTADIIGYHSPARQCPESWETVGVIAMNNGTPSATGIFSPTVFTYFSTETSIFPAENFVANMFTSVLAPTETAVACCPSGYTADPYAGCYSQFPLTQLANKTACNYVYAGDALQTPVVGEDDVYTYTFDYYGTTTTATAYSAIIPPEWTNSNNLNTSTQTVGPSGIPTGFIYDLNVSSADVTGVAQRQPVWLVYSGEESEDGEEAGGDASETPSAGRAIAPNTAWTAIIGVMAAWGVGMAAGVGLLAAW
jgi:hypothetical protein